MHANSACDICVRAPRRYLVVNTQMMMGGNKKRQLRPDEHIMASVTLYTDIINIFLHMLASMNANDNR